ncbi:hypothetical protein GTY23_02445 [Streptomyces sp. SID5998]|nr:hypothetical protein [Streptomyces sp. SID5998]
MSVCPLHRTGVRPEHLVGRCLGQVVASWRLYGPSGPPKTWKILRDCRSMGDGVHHATRGVARLHNLALGR